MNCWKTVNITKQVGFHRVFILSILFGLFGFILLYLPLSIIHRTPVMEDYGLLPLMFGFAFMPLVHKLMHILPLLCTNRQFKLEWKIKKRVFPDFKVCQNTKTSKPILILALLAPTLFLTLPLIIASYAIPSFYAYFLLFASINLGLSYVDFLYVNHVLKAPKKCVIANADQGYDILIQR